MLPPITLLASFLIVSCGGRNAERQKAYTDSLMNVIGYSPTSVDGQYALDSSTLVTY